MPQSTAHRASSKASRNREWTVLAGACPSVSCDCTRKDISHQISIGYKHGEIWRMSWFAMIFPISICHQHLDEAKKFKNSREWARFGRCDWIIYSGFPSIGGSCTLMHRSLLRLLVRRCIQGDFEDGLYYRSWRQRYPHGQLLGWHHSGLRRGDLNR